jgi:phosphoserine aminotransferase
VLTWLEETVGGLKKIEQMNREKASLIYDVIDNSDIYHGTAEVNSRSLMNITFRLSDKKTEERFLAEATQNGLHGLKGHKSVGGCRASLYNAISIDSVKKLTTFMKEFEKKSI